MFSMLAARLSMLVGFLRKRSSLLMFMSEIFISGCCCWSIVIYVPPPPDDEEPPGGEPPIINGKIAFTSTRDGNPEIYVMNADGSEQTRLTTAPGYDDGPDWGPAVDTDP